MEIKKLDLKWTGVLQPLFINSIKHIILHHTAHPTWNVMDVHNYHQRSNNWIGIGYNFFIEKDGTIYEGRGLNIGAGATGYNMNSLHICFAGNFESQIPTDEQIKAGKWLVRYLLSLCPFGVDVMGHKNIGRTACPGKNFPLKEFKEMRRMTKEEQIKHIQEKAGLDDNTMQYLQFYRYGDALIEKLANAMD